MGAKHSVPAAKETGTGQQITFEGMFVFCFEALRVGDGGLIKSRFPRLEYLSV